MNSERAQITIDYAVGMGIFLVSLIFVFQFVYGLFIPFQSSSDEIVLVTDRASSILVERMLVADKSGSTNVIDQGKLNYFLNTKLNSSNQTLYNSALRELGMLSSETAFDLNISVANTTSPNTPMYKSGPNLPENTDIGQTSRLVLIVNSSTGYNETAMVSVRAW